MACTWTYCPKTRTVVKNLQKRLTAQERDARDKWMAEFKEEFKDNNFGINLSSFMVRSAIARDKREAAEAALEVRPRPVDPAVAYSDCVEAEPVARFDYMLEEGCKNHALFKILAERLSAYAVAKICKHLFETENLKILDVECFYCQFFPIYLKRAYSWCSLDIMVKAHTAHPLPFRSLMQRLLRDPEISNTMINNFVLTLDSAGKYEFMSTVMELELTDEEFIRNIILITSAYKGADKSERLQNYIYNSLLALSSQCMSDWNYGKLLLAYLHSLCSGKITFDIRTVERLIEIHRSPFKRPCMSVLGEAIKALNEAAIPPNPS